MNRPISVLLGQNSGLAGIAYWINDNYDLSGDEAVGKRDELVLKLKDWIDAQYADGRQTSLSTAELEEQIERLSNGRLSRL